jgi:hypothetical protein
MMSLFLSNSEMPISDRSNRWVKFFFDFARKVHFTFQMDTSETSLISEGIFDDIEYEDIVEVATGDFTHTYLVTRITDFIGRPWKNIRIEM